MLVSTPIPETDDGSSEEHHVARELRIHGVSRVWVEHVGGSESIVSGITNSHHILPSSGDATISEHAQTKEEHEEGTDDEDRSLNGRQGHHSLHTTEHGEDGGDGNQTDGSIPEWQTKQILEEDTTCEGCN